MEGYVNKNAAEPKDLWKRRTSLNLDFQSGMSFFLQDVDHATWPSSFYFSCSPFKIRLPSSVRICAAGNLEDLQISNLI